MIYFTADPHFGHENINKIRPFKSVEEMNEVIINNWIKRVSDEDTIIILGDMFYKPQFDVKEILDKLPGKKILYKGNHEDWLLPKHECYFEEIKEAGYYHVNGQELYLSHYVTCGVPCKWMVHGHIHNQYSPDESFYKVVPLKLEKYLNAGVDVNNYEPVTLEEMIENNKEFKKKEIQSLKDKRVEIVSFTPPILPRQ